ncbi:hypothetical protein IA69_33070, partial [Massilia sp. JS1662]
ASMALLFGAPSMASAAARQPTAAASSPVGDSFPVVVRSARFWGLVLIVFVVSAAGLGASVHMASLLTDRDLPGAAAAQVVALSGAGVALGRVLVGALLDVVRATR